MEFIGSGRYTVGGNGDKNDKDSDGSDCNLLEYKIPMDKQGNMDRTESIPNPNKIFKITGEQKNHKITIQDNISPNITDNINEDEKNEEGEDSYRTCCGNGRTDRRLLMFSSQFCFSMITVGFCLYKLGSSTDTETTSIYLPILSSTMSLWLPSPSIKYKRNT